MSRIFDHMNQKNQQNQLGITDSSEVMYKMSSKLEKLTNIKNYL